MARIWSVFSRDYRLILALSDEPGIFNFARFPEQGVDILECSFATLQCYDAKAEPELLEIFLRAFDVDELLDGLRNHRFTVIEGRPTPSKVARL